MQHRCHYCGKILHELPYTCRRCGHRFCSDHHLPENHHCSGHHHHDHKPHHRYCGNCGRELSGMPYKCHHCGVVFCDNCRLPENHGCKVTPPDPTPIRPPKKKLLLKSLLEKIQRTTDSEKFYYHFHSINCWSDFLPSLLPTEQLSGNIPVGF